MLEEIHCLVAMINASMLFYTVFFSPLILLNMTLQQTSCYDQIKKLH